MWQFGLAFVDFLFLLWNDGTMISRGLGGHYPTSELVVDKSRVHSFSMVKRMANSLTHTTQLNTSIRNRPLIHPLAT